MTHHNTINTLAYQLSDPTTPVELPEPLPSPPLDLLLALHRVVTMTMYDDLPRAQQAAQAAWAIANRFPDNLYFRAQAHWSCGSAVLFLPAYQQSLDHYDAALHYYAEARTHDVSIMLPRDVRVVEIVRVLCLTELGRYTEAQQATDNARAIIMEQPAEQQPLLRLKLLINESGLAGDIGQYGRMIDLTEEAILLAQQQEQPGELAFAWVNRAYACIALGRLVEAEESLSQGIAAAIEAEDPLTEARALANRAVLLRSQGQLFEALNTLRLAEHGFAQATGEAAMVAQELAPIYAQLRQLPEALAAAQRASAGFATQAMPAYSARTALDGVRHAVALGRNEIAYSLLQEAINQAKLTHIPTLHAEVAIAQALVAPIARSKKALSVRQLRTIHSAATQATELLDASGLAEETARGILTLAAFDVSQGDIAAAISRYSSLTNHPSPHIQLTALHRLGELLPPETALPILKQAAHLALVQRRQLPSEELLARFSSATSSVHLQLAACRASLSDMSGALTAVWTAKGGPLIDLRATNHIYDEKTTSLVAQSKQEIARQRALVYELQRRAVVAYDEQRYAAAAQLSSQSKIAEEAALTAERAITDALRTIGGRDGRADIPTIESVQAHLPSNGALIEFAAWNGQLVALLVRPVGKTVIQPLGSMSAIRDHLNRLSLLRAESARRQEARPIELAAVLAPLGSLLLDPLRIHLNGVAQLLIAPWDILAHVPWAALFESIGWPVTTITLTPCGALWGISPPVPTQQPSLPRLLGYTSTGEGRITNVTHELTLIQANMPKAIVVSPASRADLFVTPAPELLHIAAHGHTNAALPLCSTLELADEHIMLLEIHRLDLRGTRLVTLSACETSVRPDHGDMALALAGAFLCAGAHAVIASLWPVNDAATATLMDHFYQEIAAGTDHAQALARACRALYSTSPFEAIAFQIWSGCAPQK